ncbi:hypothetical protein P3T76_015014 [Phytophthora citrophthora]|uniref:Uncharacterized protein n=1 Tax=Phytophthora citrophthora TaxID=4793 RepID=A0AAD9FZX9_9STRA|nr:hypothetical protein P3T76_015014 [Phytophthora citrophthora]
MELELPDTDVEGDGAYDALVSVNHRWLSRYARLHPNFCVDPTLLERNSLWMNSHFQKSRMITPAASPQAQKLIKKHRETVMERLRTSPLPHSESPFSTSIVDPMAALMFAASIDRCPHNNLEDFLAEAWELLQCESIRGHALQSGFASCIFRFLTDFTETQKRIPCLRLLVLLAEEDSSTVVNACKVAAQGQFWQPNMFVFSLQKRHQDNSTLCELAARLLECFSNEMPIPPPIDLNQSYEDDSSLHRINTSPTRPSTTGTALPLLAIGQRGLSPHRPLFSPITTISRLYQEAPSPYCSSMKLPLTRPPTSPVEQGRRAQVFSMPKLAAVEGQRQYRCNTPNAPPSRIDHEAGRTLDPIINSPPQSPSAVSPTKSRVAVSEKYSWNPECINSVSGFEWWWRSLPQNHTSLEPTQKLKMVTKAAVRLHSKGELQRAIELYQLALSSEANDEVKFRLQINLACAYEAADDLASSIESFRIALELNPSDPYAIYKLGSVLTLVGEFEEARMRLESILEGYPQAADGLKTLDLAVEAYQQQQETTKAAVAAAKARRSPAKIITPRVYVTTPREQIAPSIPVVRSPAPRRKKAPKREQPLSKDRDELEFCEGPAKLEFSPKPDTATVATLTEDPLSSPPNKLEILVRRCQEDHINLLEVLGQLDPQKRGLVHRESFLNLLHIITGVDNLNSNDQRVFGIPPDSWVSLGNQEYLKYQGFLNAYTKQSQAEAALRSSNEVVPVKQLIDELVRHDMANVSHQNVSEWLQLGSDRAIEGLRSTSSKASDRSTGDDESATWVTQSLGGNSEGSTPSLRASEEDIFTPRTRAKKDRAREEWVMTAEKARVLARRQQHCMKSLRNIAVRAKAHIASRRDAVAFLLVVAQNAREELTARKLRCLTARQEETAESCSDLAESTDPTGTSVGAQLDAVKELSEEIYNASARAALARLRQNSELEDLKTVATRFATLCQVPPFFLDTQTQEG